MTALFRKFFYLCLLPALYLTAKVYGSGRLEDRTLVNCYRFWVQGRKNHFHGINDIPVHRDVKKFQGRKGTLLILLRKIVGRDFFCNKCGGPVYLKEGFPGQRQHGCLQHCGLEYYPDKIREKYAQIVGGLGHEIKEKKHIESGKNA